MPVLIVTQNPHPVKADQALADVLARELSDLIDEIEAATGVPWIDAIMVALSAFPDLMEYADAWDAWVVTY